MVSGQGTLELSVGIIRLCRKVISVLSNWEVKKVRKQNVAHSRLFFAVVFAASVFVSGGSAFGQLGGFVVQPMRLDIAALPGRIFETALGLQSFDPNQIQIVDLSIIEMAQWEDGQWRIIEPNSDFDTSKLSSCTKWISVERETVEISLMGSAYIKVRVRVPRRTRGFYAAGILVTLRPRPDLEGNVAVTVRFLVPVLVEVQGRPLRHKIELGDMGLELIEARQGHPATTHVLMNIDNKGGTRSNLKGFAQVKAFLDGHWRQITETEFGSTRIIPGAKLRLRSNIGRPLPSAKYRVSGWLYVDGRRAQRITKEIDFVGDTSVTKVITDSPLDLLPSFVSISGLPGATRMASIKVYNASDEPVNVQMAIGLPRTLKGVTFGDLKGVDLDCTEWLKIEPQKFTLRSHTQQSIRITAKMPDTVSASLPCYYALLGLYSTYADGQRAGVTTANICVANKNISVEPFVYGMTLRPALKDGSEYYIVARFGNFGSIHFTPIRCRVAVVDPATSMPRVITSLSSRKTGMMLPFEARDFSGIMDFSRVPVGMYRLAVELQYGTGQMADKQIGIRVMTQGGQKVIEVLQLQEDLGGKIEVKW